MKKFQLLLLLVTLFLPGISAAQQLVPSVISSSGGFFSNTSGMLSFTIGELTAVETYSSPTLILTQGFQQAWDFGTYVIDHPRGVFTFGVYPNPSDGNVNLLTESEINVDLRVRVVDLLGRPVIQTMLNHQQNTQVNPLDLSHAPPGIYLMTLVVKSYDFIEVEQTVKIEIIK